MYVLATYLCCVSFDFGSSYSLTLNSNRHFQSEIFSSIIQKDIHTGTMAAEEELDMKGIFYQFASAEKEGDDPTMSRTDITMALKVIVFHV